MLTITFAADLTTKEAQKKLANFKRRVLRDNFGHSITVREFTARGRPHFHLVIDCKGDVSTGYNWRHHDAMTAWSKAGRKEAKPQGKLNRSPRLKLLHEVLKEKAPLYGLGRIELVPVKKPEAIAFYLGGYLAKSLANKPPDAKGTRAVNYSHKCPRLLSGRWSWANAAGWVWRAKLGKWAAKHRCASMDELKALFGNKWAYHHRHAILDTELDYYPTSQHAAFDGVWVPPDSIDIRIIRSSIGFEDRQEVALDRQSPMPCECSQAERGAVALSGASFPPEEGFEGKRGSPLVPPVGDSTPAEPRQKRAYMLLSRAALDDRLKKHHAHYQRPLRGL